MDKALIAQTVANKLFATEDAVDTAILQASKLMGGMRVSAVVGDDAVSKVAAALSALTEARKAVVEAHHELAEVKLRVGIRTKLLGVTDKSMAAEHEPLVAHRRAS
jgi:hypothetical protein